jgi:putative sterol carrier protein
MTMADLTVAQIFENMKTKLTADPGKIASMKAIYQFNVTGDGGGEWFVRVNEGAFEIGGGAAADAECTVTVTDADFIAISTGELNPQMAFMTGKVRISGNMGLAMKLGKILG